LEHVDTYNQLVPDSPNEYRARKEVELNEMRSASGLEVKQIYKRTADIKQLQNAAGVI
jgi:hypothetical protein